LSWVFGPYSRCTYRNPKRGSICHARETLVDAHVAIDEPIAELHGAGGQGAGGGVDVEGGVGVVDMIVWVFVFWCWRMYSTREEGENEAQ